VRRRIARDLPAAGAGTWLNVGEAGERLIDQHEALGRKPSTIEGYRSALTVHLIPFFVDKPLGRIAREDVVAS
jgi:hypothetical protein